MAFSLFHEFVNIVSDKWNYFFEVKFPMLRNITKAKIISWHVNRTKIHYKYVQFKFNMLYILLYYFFFIGFYIKLLITYDTFNFI